MLTCDVVKGFLDNSFSTLFSCSQVGEHLRVSTPFSYPDGDVLDVFIMERSGQLVVSDAGETMRYLSSYDLDMKSYSKRHQILTEVTESLGIRYFKGTFSRFVSSVDEIPSVIFDLAQCVIRICDLLYTVRGSSPVVFAEDVKDFLDFNKLKFEENYTVETDSDNRYDVDLAVEVGNNLRLVEMVNPPAKVTSKPRIDRIIRMWADIDSFSDFELESRITLFNDGGYLWRESEIRLIQKFSVVTYWSNKEEFIRRLIAKSA